MLRLPVAGLGLYMVWCSLFASYAVKLGLTGWMGTLAGAQGIAAAMIWTAAMLDPDRSGPMLETMSGPDGADDGIKLSGMVGRSPVGWIVLVFAIWVCPAFAAKTGITPLGFLGWSWALLFMAVTMASNAVRSD